MWIKWINAREININAQRRKLNYNYDYEFSRLRSFLRSFLSSRSEQSTCWRMTRCDLMRFLTHSPRTRDSTNDQNRPIYIFILIENTRNFRFAGRSIGIDWRWSDFGVLETRFAVASEIHTNARLGWNAAADDTQEITFSKHNDFVRFLVRARTNDLYYDFYFY